MKKKYPIFALVFLTLFLFNLPTAFSNRQYRYAGYWLTFDGKSRNPRSIVRLKQSRNRVTGHSVVTFYTKRKPSKYCVKCRGVYRNRFINSVPIFSGQINPTKKKQSCKIFNTGSGKSYSCYFYLMNRGKTLVIRAYLGTPLFGRTMHWRRISASAARKYRGKVFVRLK